MEARDERRLLRLQKQLAGHKLLIIDELGYVPLSKTGAELLFELISQRYERGSTLVTSNLPFDEWTETFGSERLTGALLDRLTHHVHILEMNGDAKQPGWPFRPTRLGTRQLFGERACQGAPAPSQHPFQIPAVADYCAAPWLVFPPPLTQTPVFSPSSSTAPSGTWTSGWLAWLASRMVTVAPSGAAAASPSST